MKSKKTIALIEDDYAIQAAMQLMFANSDYNLEVYTNGSHFLTDNYRLPDLFILDKQLPGVDGLDICRHLKSSQKSKDIPVIMLSASPKAGSLATEAGANAFIEKPFRKNDLFKMVSQFLISGNDGELNQKIIPTKAI